MELTLNEVQAKSLLKEIVLELVQERARLVFRDHGRGIGRNRVGECHPEGPARPVCR